MLLNFFFFLSPPPKENCMLWGTQCMYENSDCPTYAIYISMHTRVTVIILAQVLLCNSKLMTRRTLRAHAVLRFDIGIYLLSTTSSFISYQKKIGNKLHICVQKLTLDYFHTGADFRRFSTRNSLCKAPENRLPLISVCLFTLG